jgi:hypothetical protein
MASFVPESVRGLSSEIGPESTISSYFYFMTTDPLMEKVYSEIKKKNKGLTSKELKALIYHIAWASSRFQDDYSGGFWDGKESREQAKNILCGVDQNIKNPLLKSLRVIKQHREIMQKVLTSEIDEGFEKIQGEGECYLPRAYPLVEILDNFITESESMELQIKQQLKVFTKESSDCLSDLNDVANNRFSLGLFVKYIFIGLHNVEDEEHRLLSLGPMTIIRLAQVNHKFWLDEYTEDKFNTASSFDLEKVKETVKFHYEKYRKMSGSQMRDIS